MYLSAERIALANQAIRETFEQTCVAWQAIPHWDTGDPGQTRVRADSVNDLRAASLELIPDRVGCNVTLAVAVAPTPDPLLARVMASTVELARKVDGTVLSRLRTEVPVRDIDFTSVDKIPGVLIGARAIVEDRGYRAPSCLLTNTRALQQISTLISGESVVETSLKSANVNALHRASQLDEQAKLDEKTKRDEKTKKGDPLAVALFLGRRQRIAQGAAASASPGEEPVDIAISVLPSLEVVGEASTAGNEIEMAVRICFVMRIKDSAGVVALVEKPSTAATNDNVSA
jgi:hypothetical protein